MYAVRLIGDSWYKGHHSMGVMTEAHLNDAKHYRTREEALTAAMLLAVAYPVWMGKLRVHKIKKLRIQKVMAERDSAGKVTQLWPEQVDHYVTG